jgi:hypothetical protein
MSKLRLSMTNQTTSLLILFVALEANVCMAAQNLPKVHGKFTVTAVSHNIEEHDYQTLEPQTDSASCTVYKNRVYCGGSSMPAHYEENAWYEFTQVVSDGVHTYTLRRLARWRWSSMVSLNDRDTYVAERNGKHMKITYYDFNGKHHADKWEIIGINQDAR